MMMIHAMNFIDSSSTSNLYIKKAAMSTCLKNTLTHQFTCLVHSVMGTKGFQNSKLETVLKQHENANICHPPITCLTPAVLVIGLVSVSSTNLPIMHFTGNQSKQIVEDNSYVYRGFL